MKYSDNPRKLYGKVEIVYADEELSRDVKAAVSANSATLRKCINRLTSQRLRLALWTEIRQWTELSG